MLMPITGIYTLYFCVVKLCSEPKVNAWNLDFVRGSKVAVVNKAGVEFLESIDIGIDFVTERASEQMAKVLFH